MALQDLKDRILAPATADPFSLAYLNLCLISYQTPSSIPNLVATMAPWDPGGSWQCTWGPVLDTEEGNLVFVAVYKSGPYPVCAAVVIRGTDLDLNHFWGSLEQIWEDMDVLVQASLPWPTNSGVLVANGTLEALVNIQKMQSPGKGTLEQNLVQFLGNPANENPLLIVTGHSLGGCLTTIVAPWLQFALKQAGLTTPIVPATFAAPTAGNAAFAQYYQSGFSYQLRYQNLLDIAPTAWSNLAYWATIYDPTCGFPLPQFAYAAILGWLGLMWEYGVSYAQPFPNVALNGACQTPPSWDWYAEAYHQHHATTYWSLLGGGPLPPELLQRPFVVPRRRIHRPGVYARLGDPKAWVEKLR